VAIPEEYTASIIRAEDGGSIFLQNVHLQDYTKELPERPQLMSSPA
jgi:hypothetical protein